MCEPRVSAAAVRRLTVTPTGDGRAAGGRHRRRRRGDRRLNRTRWARAALQDASQDVATRALFEPLQCARELAERGEGRRFDRPEPAGDCIAKRRRHVGRPVREQRQQQAGDARHRRHAGGAGAGCRAVGAELDVLGRRTTARLRHQLPGEGNRFVRLQAHPAPQQVRQSNGEHRVRRECKRQPTPSRPKQAHKYSSAVLQRGTADHRTDQGFEKYC